jgi:hypothetical protein
MLLLFNQIFQHCISPCTTYASEEVLCLLLYLLTAIVGKNDNTLRLMEMDSLKGEEE